MSRSLQPHFGSGGVLVLAEIPGEGIILARGTTVPTDTTAGYAKGCLFVKTDGGIGSTLYVNEGTKASSDFNVAL